MEDLINLEMGTYITSVSSHCKLIGKTWSASGILNMYMNLTISDKYLPLEPFELNMDVENLTKLHK